MVLAGAVSVAPVGCSWDALWGLDAARPSLKEADTFHVDPLCPELIIDDSALATIPRIVTLTGRRHKSGLSAQSVPVVVRRGACDPSRADAGAVDASVDAGAAADAGTTVAPGDGPRCQSGTAALDGAELDGLELVALEERGCRQRSPARLDCTLNARGEAAFGIIGRFDEDELGLSGHLPICITPLEYEETAHHVTEVRVVPRFGTARVALAVVELPDIGSGPAPQLDSTTCESSRSCDQRAARAGFQAGIVGTDFPAAMLAAGDLLQASRDVPLRLIVRSLGVLPTDEAQPFLSTQRDCAIADAGAPAELALTLLDGVRGSETFYLCASGFPMAYQVIATLAPQRAAETDAASEGEASEEREATDSPATRPAETPVSGDLRRYVVEPAAAGYVLHTELCGGERVHTPFDSVRIDGERAIDDGDRVLIVCDADGDEDAGAATSGGGSLGSGEAECRHVELELTATGDTCRLTLPSN